MKLIAEQLNGDLSSIANSESRFAEHDTGEVRIYLENNASQSTIDELQGMILSQGVVLTGPIVQDANMIIIPFQKAIAPLLIIGGAIAAIIVGITGWQIFKMTTAGIPLWAIIVGGGALAYLLFNRPAKKAAPFVIQTGKAYITRKVSK